MKFKIFAKWKWIITALGLFLHANLSAQSDSLKSVETIRLLDQSFSSLEKNELDSERFQKWMDDLIDHVTFFKIPLKESRSFIQRTAKYIQANPQLKKKAKILDFLNAVIELSLGETAKFDHELSKLNSDLLLSKDFEELFLINLMASSYLIRFQDTSRAAKYFNQNEDLFKQLKPEECGQAIMKTMSHNANSHGFLLMNQNKLSEALVDFQFANERAKKTGDMQLLGLTYGNIGVIYLKQEKWDSAEIYLLKDYNFSIQSGLNSSATNSLLQLSKIAINSKNYDLASKRLDMAEKLFLVSDTTGYLFVNRFKLGLAFQRGIIAMFKGEIPTAKSQFEKTTQILSNITESAQKQLYIAKNQRFSIEQNLSDLNELEMQSKRNQNILGLAGILFLVALIFIIQQYRFNTTLQKKNIEIADQAKKLEHLNTQKNKLFSILAHDLRGPIRNFESLVQMLDDGDIDKELFLDSINKIKFTLPALVGTLENLLIWVKHEMENGIQLNSIEINANEFIKEQVNQVMPLAISKKVNLCFVLQNEPNIIFHSDPFLLSVVVRNLIHNALKFTPTNKDIRVLLSLNELKNQVNISIEDQGIGIGPKKVEQLLHDGGINNQTAGTAGEKGSGLGLNICKEFIAAMGGELQIKSEINKGSTFTVLLPIKSI
jgi:signal transduction histidine kinase